MPQLGSRSLLCPCPLHQLTLPSRCPLSLSVCPASGRGAAWVPASGELSLLLSGRGTDHAHCYVPAAGCGQPGATPNFLQQGCLLEPQCSGEAANSNAGCQGTLDADGTGWAHSEAVPSQPAVTARCSARCHPARPTPNIPRAPGPGHSRAVNTWTRGSCCYPCPSEPSHPNTVCHPSGCLAAPTPALFWGWQPHSCCHVPVWQCHHCLPPKVPFPAAHAGWGPTGGHHGVIGCRGAWGTHCCSGCCLHLGVGAAAAPWESLTYL